MPFRGVRLVEGVAHDYQRHGTITLFAALNVLDGARSSPSANLAIAIRSFLAILRHIEANVPAQFDFHLVVDNYATRVGTFTSRPPARRG